MSSHAEPPKSPDFYQKEAERSEDDKNGRLWPLVTAYAGKSTVHGLPSTLNSPFYSGQRYVWMFLLLITAAGLTTVVTFQLIHYYSYPTVINVLEEPIKVVDVPDVTFCATEQLVITQYYNPWYPQNDTSGAGVAVSIIRAVAVADLSTCPQGAATTPGYCYLEHVMNTTPFIVLTVSWGRKPLELFNTTQSHIEPVLTRAGRCETFRTTQYVNSIRNPINGSDSGDEPLDVILAVKESTYLQKGERIGVQVTLHSSRVYPVIYKNKLYLPVNHSCAITFSLTKTISLRHPYQPLTGNDCYQTSSAGFRNPLARYPMYTEELCKAECLANYTVAECGCRFFLDQALVRNSTEQLCDSGSLDCAFRAREEMFPSIPLPCKCPPQCSRNAYHSAVTCTQLYRPEFSMVHISVISVGSMKTIVKQEPVYTTETILSTVGGLVGLFLGFSLVSCVEFLELFILSCKSLMRKETKIKHQE